MNKAPFVIQDTMPGAIHPGTQLYTESRAEWERWNRETGWETSGRVQEVNRGALERERRAARKADRIQAIQRAKHALENGLHPRSYYYKESLRREKMKRDVVTKEMQEKILAEYLRDVTKDMERKIEKMREQELADDNQ